MTKKEITRYYPINRVYTKAYRTLCLVLITLVSMQATGLAKEARNVILMITDGAGFNTFDCASYYEFGELGHQPYDTFPIRMSCTTWSDGGSYDPDTFWADFDYSNKKTHRLIRGGHSFEHRSEN